MKMPCWMIYSIPVGQHRMVTDNKKYFPEFNSTSIFKWLEYAYLPLGIWKFCLSPNACLKFFSLNSYYASELSTGMSALCGTLSVQCNKSRLLTFLLANSGPKQPFHFFLKLFCHYSFVLLPQILVAAPFPRTPFRSQK